MTVTTQGELPGITTVPELEGVLRQALVRPALVIDEVVRTPVAHEITAPATGSLDRVLVAAHDDGGPVELRLVVKVLQSALHGLPPQMPAEDRERVAAGIPWRLEAEVYAGDTGHRMPPGLRLPRLYAALERPGDRIELWLEDVDPVEGPWDTDDLVRAATALGRLTVRRADQQLAGLPPATFLEHLVANALRHWAIPAMRGELLWAHPAFAQPEVTALRDDLLGLAGQVDELFDSLRAVPWRNTHGDPTPMNVLRPRGEPGTLVLIDWGTASRGPVGWDLVPLVFGPAENGTAPPDDLGERLAVAVPAFEAGLAQDGLPQPAGLVGRVVRTCALLRYPFTSLPLGPAMSGQPTPDDLMGYASRKATFVRAVLDVCSPAALR